ncbi:hypothetical protein KSP39_PZI003953 [Platanthera zijinensis]|uniref:Uncharacterized protein n=1 Tax=Platanthera zijinensis TaxID=2320716 RepID=A0AAP0BVL4_9ASPA
MRDRSGGSQQILPLSKEKEGKAREENQKLLNGNLENHKLLNGNSGDVADWFVELKSKIVELSLENRISPAGVQDRRAES